MYLTVKGKTDGFGAQYQAILSGIAYCRYKKITYIHTPFFNLYHGVDTKKANEFIGIDTNIEMYKFENIIELPFVREVHYSKLPSIYYTKETLEYIRNCYYSTLKPDVTQFDIAIHIRRGDVDINKNSERYLSNDVYKKIISKLRELHPEKNITIFSEGKNEDFKELGLEDSSFKLNLDVFETFHSLVTSKILVIGFSSFSYCAGLISTNTVYYHDSFWHKKLDHWLSVTDNLMS